MNRVIINLTVLCTSLFRITCHSGHRDIISFQAVDTYSKLSSEFQIKSINRNTKLLCLEQNMIFMIDTKWIPSDNVQFNFNQYFSDDVLIIFMSRANETPGMT